VASLGGNLAGGLAFGMSGFVATALVRNTLTSLSISDDCFQEVVIEDLRKNNQIKTFQLPFRLERI